MGRRAASAQRRILSGLLASFLALGTVVGIESQAPLAPAEATATTTSVDASICRSTDGTGATLDTNTLNNGYYVSAASRTSDTVNGIRIDPLYSKRMYVDPGRNFNATYVAYRITNLSGQTLNNLWVGLSGFSSGGVVFPATLADTAQPVGTLVSGSINSSGIVSPSGATKTVYFLMRATGTSSADQRHEVRVFDGNPALGTQLAGCHASFQGVQRSIAANPNKVTSIQVVGSPVLGQTLQVIVSGTPGKVGQGSGPDGSIMALSPASYAQWPTQALRLESASITIAGLNASAQAACEAVGGVDGGSGNRRTSTFTETLVIRAFQTCANTTKQSYVSTYTFRVIGAAATNPAIVPLASISSGTQIKYTGSLPSAAVTVPLTETTFPVSVTKARVGSVTPVNDAGNTVTLANATRVKVEYTLTTISTSGTVVFDAFEDRPDFAKSPKFEGATYTDSTRGTATAISKIDVGSGATAAWRFIGPFSTVQGGTAAVLTYAVSYPKPLSNTNYVNYGYAISGNYTIGSGGNITGVGVSIDETGVITAETTPTLPKPKSPQTIAFDPPSVFGGNSLLVLEGFTDSGLPLSYTAGPAGACAVTEFDGVYTLQTLDETQGPCQVTATQAGNAEYDAADPVVRTINLLKGQAITANAGSLTTTTVSVIADSKLPVTLVSLDTTICTVAVSTAYNSDSASPGYGTTVYTVTKGSSTAGSCILVASQPGDGTTWAAAPDKDVLIGVGRAQTISFSSPTAGSNQNLGTSFAASGTSTANSSLSGTSKLPLQFRSLTPLTCVVEPPSLTANGEVISQMNSTTGVTTVTISTSGREAGTCTLEISQDGIDDNGEQSAYAPATVVTRSVTIVANGATDQVVVLTSPTTKTYGDASFTVSAEAKTPNSAGTPTNLRVTLSGTPGICTVGTSTLSGSVSTASVQLLSAGDCVITALQPGNATYKSATATETITVAKKTVSVTGLNAQSKMYDASDSATFSGNPSLSGIVSGDTSAEISLTGTPTGTFASPFVANGISVTVTGLQLAGTKVGSYELQAFAPQANITARPITLRADSATVNDDTGYQCGYTITSGALQGTDEIHQFTCTTAGTGPRAVGDYTNTLSAIGIRQPSPSLTDVTGSYTITLLTGTLTVSNDEVPTIEAENVTIVYGEVADVADYLTTTKPVAVKRQNGNVVNNGSVNQRINGSAIPQRPAAGNYTVDISFTAANGSGIANRNSTRSLTVQQRPLRLTVPSYSKLRGQADPTFAPTAGAIDGNANSGFASGETEADIGGVTATRAAGAVPGNYAITPAPGSNNPNYQKTAVPGTLYIADLRVRGTQNGSVFEVSTDVVCECETFKPGTTATVTVTQIQPQSFSFVIFGFDIFSFFRVQTTLTDTATIAGDGSCPLLAVNNVPEGDYTVVISGTSPTDDVLTQNLSIKVIDANPPTVQNPPAPSDPAPSDPGPAPTTPAPTPTPTVSPTPTPTVSPSPTAPAPTPRPTQTAVTPRPAPTPTQTQSPAPAETPAATPSPTPTRSQATQEPEPEVTAAAPVPTTNRPIGDGLLSWFSPQPQTPAGGTQTGDTQTDSNEQNASGSPANPAPEVRFDTGGEVRLTENGSVDLSSVRSLTPQQLANETIGGFTPGTGLNIEVLGSRTGARFVATTANVIDRTTLIEAIQNSIPAQAADFFQLESVAISQGPGDLASWDREQTLLVYDYFQASGLEAPINLADLDLESFVNWIGVSGRAAGYVPGTPVFLTLTSTPIVIAEAIVTREGNVEISGSFPAELLEAGEHRVRLVGIRSLGGVSVDDAGEITLSPETLAEIERFDLGTQATVRMGGTTPEGDYLNAIRVVPLVPVAPWWTLWFILAGLIIAGVARRRNWTNTNAKLYATAGLALVSAAPAVILGWLSTVTMVTWVGLAFGLIAAVATFVIQPSDAARESQRKPERVR